MKLNNIHHGAIVNDSFSHLLKAHDRIKYDWNQMLTIIACLKQERKEMERLGAPPEDLKKMNKKILTLKEYNIRLSSISSEMANAQKWMFEERIRELN